MSGVTVSFLTSPGRGAIATCRIEGPIVGWNAEPVLFRPATGAPLAQRAVGRVVYGTWGAANPEDVVAVRTAETTTEISCHGGSAAPERVLADLVSCGSRTIDWHEDLRTRTSLVDAEITEALVRAPTVRTAAFLLGQWGLWEREVAGMMTSPTAEAAQRLALLRSWSKFGRHLTEPWRVLLIGRPNVGKSSLGNALLGYARSIVDAEAGTTRDVLTGATAVEGWPLAISDTAGLRDACDPVEAAGVSRARAQIEQADLAVVVVDGHEPPTEFDRELLASLPDSLVAFTKSDLLCVWSAEPGQRTVSTSAVTGEGVSELLAAVVRRLIPEEPPSGMAIPISARQTTILTEAEAAAEAGDAETLCRTLAAFVGS